METKTITAVAFLVRWRSAWKVEILISSQLTVIVHNHVVHPSSTTLRICENQNIKSSTRWYIRDIYQRRSTRPKNWNGIKVRSMGCRPATKYGREFLSHLLRHVDNLWIHCYCLPTQHTCTVQTGYQLQHKVTKRIIILRAITNNTLTTERRRHKWNIDDISLNHVMETACRNVLGSSIRLRGNARPFINSLYRKVSTWHHQLLCFSAAPWSTYYTEVLKSFGSLLHAMTSYLIVNQATSSSILCDASHCTFRECSRRYKKDMICLYISMIGF